MRSKVQKKLEKTYQARQMIQNHNVFNRVNRKLYGIEFL